MTCWWSSAQFVSAPRAAPADACLCAIGDIHGNATELDAPNAVIAELARQSLAARQVLVYLGDYVDRGREIVRTIELLIAQKALDDGLERIFLVGNHDQFVMELLHPGGDVSIAFVTTWLENGGETTRDQFGVEGYGRVLMADDMKGLSMLLRKRLGESACDFFKSLRPMHREGAYLFVHAGFDPGLPVDQQDLADLLLIRVPFLSCRGWPHDFVVVHGHSIAMPRVLSHRLGVDAGCYRHGALCAVQIVHDRLRYLGVTRRRDFDWRCVLGGHEAEWQWADPLEVAA